MTCVSPLAMPRQARRRCDERRSECQAAGGQPKQITYADLIRADPSAATQDELQANGTVTYLNSRSTIQAKAQLAKTYGGIMVWEAGQDAAGDASLLQAIRDAVP